MKAFREILKQIEQGALVSFYKRGDHTLYLFEDSKYIIEAEVSVYWDEVLEPYGELGDEAVFIRNQTINVLSVQVTDQEGNIIPLTNKEKAEIEHTLEQNLEL